MQDDFDIRSIPNFWTAERCDQVIEESEELGFSPALVQTRRGQRRIPSIRNNQRVLFTDFELADEIWKNLKLHVPQKLGNSTALGLNEMFRVYKYDAWESFKKHKDQSYIRNEKEFSFITFMIYLNDNFIGGATSFKNTVIEAQKGSCLLFKHELDHEGEVITEGVKYVLRTDVMYQLKF